MLRERPDTVLWVSRLTQLVKRNRMLEGPGEVKPGVGDAEAICKVGPGDEKGTSGVSKIGE